MEDLLKDAWKEHWDKRQRYRLCKAFGDIVKCMVDGIKQALEEPMTDGQAEFILDLVFAMHMPHELAAEDFEGIAAKHGIGLKPNKRSELDIHDVICLYDWRGECFPPALMHETGRYYEFCKVAAIFCESTASKEDDKEMAEDEAKFPQPYITVPGFTRRTR